MTIPLGVVLVFDGSYGDEFNTNCVGVGRSTTVEVAESAKATAVTVCAVSVDSVGVTRGISEGATEGTAGSMAFPRSRTATSTAPQQ
jgi:hypothetical protein